MSEMESLYQQVIIDHSRNPRHFAENKDAQVTQECLNPLCGDHIELYCDFEDNDESIHRLSFTGKGCAISVASASLMVQSMQNKDKAFFERTFAYFKLLIDGKEQAADALLDGLSNPEKIAVRKVRVLAGVRQYPMRVKCATCAWHTMAAVIKGGSTTVQTETD